MKFTYRWITELLGEAPPLADLCDRLTRAGIEVEALQDLGAGSGKIVVAKALAVEPHPQADKLRLVTVALDDEAAETTTVVCGAPNVVAGGRYALARLGAVLPDGMEVTAATIRGVESRGMLCSGAELGWNDDADGLMDLSDDLPLGEPFDARLEVKVGPNRPDCLSLFGIARDLAAMSGRRLAAPKPTVDESPDDIRRLAAVEVADPAGCPRYMARVVRGVTVGPSPLWLVRRLEGAGLRAINNLVDITNYVMLETGHPLHAFDLDRLGGQKIVVRRAADRERLRLLDDTELTLTPQDLVIADAERAHVLAGIMGGEESEVRDATRNVLIECACFQTTTIRRSSRRHAKSSDSSYRFERGVNIHDMRAAIDRAAELMARLGGGTVAKGVLDVAAPLPGRPRIELSVAACNHFLGTSLNRETIGDGLRALHFELHDVRDDRLVVSPPDFRLDVAREADLYEEVARIVGFDAIPTTLPRIDVTEIPEAPLLGLERTLRRALASAGLHEALTYAFADPKLVQPFVPEGVDAAALALSNPLATPEHSVMRASLVPGLLLAAATNQSRQQRDVALFELGTVFRERGAPPKGAPREATALVSEWQHCVAVLGGSLDADWRSSGKGRAVDFFDMKGLAESLLVAAGVAGARFEADADVTWLHPGRSGRFVSEKGVTLLRVGQLHPALKELFGLRDERLLLLEGYVAEIADARHDVARYRSLPRQPAVQRSIAVVVERATPAAQLQSTIAAEGGEVLESVRAFDVFVGEALGAECKSLAFELLFRAADRSLADDEVNAMVGRIVERLGREHGAVLRT